MHDVQLISTIEHVLQLSLHFSHFSVYLFAKYFLYIIFIIFLIIKKTYIRLITKSSIQTLAFIDTTFILLIFKNYYYTI